MNMRYSTSSTLASVVILAVKVYHTPTARKCLPTTTPCSIGISINASCVTPQRLFSSLTVSGMLRGAGQQTAQYKISRALFFPFSLTLSTVRNLIPCNDVALVAYLAQHAAAPDQLSHITL